MPEKSIPIPDMTRWMSDDVVAESMTFKQQLLEIWTKYIQMIGPSVVAAYREGKLMELPNVHAFNRVKDEMQQIALELLVEEEIRQDDQEKTRQKGRASTSSFQNQS